MKRTALALFVGVLWLPAVAGAKTSDKPDMTGKQEHSMAHCPSAVAKAVTVIENRKDGVALMVTAPNVTAAQEIQKRAELQSNVAEQPARGAIEHTGEGTGSGQFGFCPGMVQGTSVTVEKLPDGARLIVRARVPAQVQELQQSTRERLHRMQAKR